MPREAFPGSPCWTPKASRSGTSDGPKGNIGYPFKPEEIDHFMALIAKESRRIEAGQHDGCGNR